MQICLKISVAGDRVQGAERTNDSYLPNTMFEGNL